MNQPIWHLLATALVSACVASCSGTAGSGGNESSSGASSSSGTSTKPGRDSGPRPDTGLSECGATGPELCANGGVCKSGADCTSTVCQSEMCVPASCELGTVNGQETDVNCGGPVCGGCGTGKKCLMPRDCQSVVCTGDVCQAPTDHDMVKNDSETDVDCGGALLASGKMNPASDGAPSCAVGKKCLLGSDCTTSVCASGPLLVDNLDGGIDADAAVSGGDAGAGSLTCQPATDHDGVKNDSETDVDCGGALLASGQPNTMSDGAPACSSGQKCALATDCISLVCKAGVCDAPSATDGVQNDSETDVDCGGALVAGGAANPSSDGAPACADGKNCLLGTDCVDLVCAAAPVGTMGSPDGSPIDCAAGTTCTCQPPTDTDGVKNDSESDIDCGGGFILAAGAPNPKSDGAQVCAIGQSCALGTDCSSGVCNTNMEMGGPPVNCPAGDMCVCQAASPTDGIQNGAETDIDCGGATSAGSDGAPTCGTSKKCKLALDCTNLVCTAGVCAAPTHSDGVMNDSETDVDCGGALLASGQPNTASDGAPACPDNEKCVLDGDCLAGFCSAITNRCVDGQSCKGLIKPAPIQDISKYASLLVNGADAVGVPDPNGAGQSAGLDTCGAGESTDAPGIQLHESCCKSLPMPKLPSCSSTVPCTQPLQTCSSKTTTPGTCQLRMDKYEATTGRVRQFVESVNKWSQANGTGPYNMQAWVKAQLAPPMTPIGVLLSQMIPTSGVGATSVVQFYPTGDATTNQNTYLNVVAQLGGTTIDRNHPSGVQGCFTGVGDAGSSTYWWPSDEISSVGSPPRPFTQDYYDIKSQNCAPYWIGAAFCAWDGGRLPTQAESNAVYGTSTYPWGPSLYPNPYPGNTVILANAEKADTSGIGIGTFIPGNPLVPGAPGYTINFWNANLGAATGLGDFYFYPSYPISNPANGPLGEDAIPDTLSNDLDLTPYIAAPGRFILDLTTARSASGDNEGWYDYGANMFEYLEVSTLTGNIVSNYVDTADTPNVTLAPSMIGVYWEGGSWEGHGIQPGGYNEAMQTQYSKAGFRCVRAIEP